MDMATTTHKEQAMTTTNSILYISDNGRATCPDHAGEYLKQSIAERPNQDIHLTPIGAWERFTIDEIIAFDANIFCDCCAR